MKRDLNLFREILLRCESHEHGFAPDPFEIPGYTDERVGFHVYLLGEAGLLITTPVTSFDDKSPVAVAGTMTNAGYDFLEKTRSPDVWEKTQRAVSKVGGWTVQTVIMIATEIFHRKLKEAINETL